MFEVIAPTRSNYCRKMRKIAINQPFLLFSAIDKRVRELVILVTFITKLSRIDEKRLKLSRPQGQIIGKKSQQIEHFDFLLAIIELVR